MMNQSRKVTKNDTLGKQSIRVNDTAYVVGFNRLAVWVKDYDAESDRYLCTMPYNNLEWISSDKLQKHYAIK